MDSDDHPLLTELTSLRQTAARFQHEAHAAAIKLQRYSLDSSRLHQHAAALEQENIRLVHELETLRTNPDVQQHPAVAQVQELSLALRRVSEKITLTEHTLLQRTSELADARNEIVRVKYAADGAHAFAAYLREREGASKARERELESKARASEQERKMVDLVVKEYADLVRNLEGRKSASNTSPVSNGSASSITLVDNLQDNKSTLHRMLSAFSTESEQLHATIAQLNAKVSDLQMTLDAERNAASHDRTLLSQAKTDLDKHNLEDQTAAKMVARYMKFSQSSTNTLQQQITTLKTRHASTISTYELQLSILESQLASEHARTARLQDALDELCEDLARESYGRRREVALRLALLSREEAVAEFMQRWVRRAREFFTRCYNQPPSSEDVVRDAFQRVVDDAESLLSTLDDEIQLSDVVRTSGSLARIALSREAVEALRIELQDEVKKRIDAVRKCAFFFPEDTVNDNDTRKNDSQPEVPPPLDGDGALNHFVFTPNSQVASVEPLGLASPLSAVGPPEESNNEPFVVHATVTPPFSEPGEPASVQEEVHPASLQDSASTLATLLVDEQPKALSPAVSTLDLRQDAQSPTATTNEEPLLAFPDDTTPPEEVQPPEEQVQVQMSPTPPELDMGALGPTDDAMSIPSTPAPVARDPTPPPSPDPLLTELAATAHRYDALQHALRDCSLAIKDLRRVLASTPQSARRHHLDAALARIDDYTEDARVELEIRIADEALTARGFATVLSVPGVGAGERAETEVSARAFVDGTDAGVVRALTRFGGKREDVVHDVAVVKRAVHAWAMEDTEDGEDRGAEGENGWTTWTSGLMGGTPSRTSTPAPTFGKVMASPRLRHAVPAAEDALAGLELRIPMPAAVGYGVLGMGQPQGPARPRTVSALYAMPGLRASSIGLGVGLGGSPSPARTRGHAASGLGGVSAPLASPMRVDTPVTERDLGGVE